MSELASFLKNLVSQRVAHVQDWVDSNIAQSGLTNISVEELRRAIDPRTVELRSIELYTLTCESCLLRCPNTRFHEGNHDCSMDRRCPHSCHLIDEHADTIEKAV